jgi:DNA polymerase I-like protein with 3'-5' exonuclease and polymerase domains
VKLIAQAREINKAHTTFIDTILKHNHKGRIHAEINQLRSDNGGTVTGRFSILIQIYSKYQLETKTLDHVLGHYLYPRKAIDGVVFDYSQQEPRLVVHYAALQNLYGVDEVLEAYKKGDADFHTIVADMAEIPRSQAKTINLGLFYGMGKNKLQAELGINKQKAEDLFRQYHNKVPFVKQLWMQCNAIEHKTQVRLELYLVDYVGFICGSLINLVFTNHYHMMQRSWNTDQGLNVLTHTKL